MINLPEHERKWERIYLTIRERIEDGTYPVHSAIPSITKLEQMFPASRITIRKALAQLEEHNFTHAIPGKGRYVRPKEEWSPPKEGASS